MGRDVTGLRSAAKPNAKSNGLSLDRVHVAPRIQKEKVETKEQEVEDHNPKATVTEESPEKQDVLGVKSTNTEADVPEGKAKVESLKPSEKKSSSPVKPAPETVVTENLQTSTPTLQSPELSTEKRASHASSAGGGETFDTSSSPSSKTSDLHTPVAAKKPQPHSPLMSSKGLQLDSKKKHYDEEDNYSLASSAATSIRSNKFKVTVPVAPTFKSADRAARRKEFYMKLEEKHKALEAEKLEYAARTKEEEEAALKQLRKAMAYKANPVPSFYREGPPPKVELKKLPVTRAKSPNLTTRRKSCNDAIKSSTPEEKKATTRTTRHSIGVYKSASASPSTPKIKDLSSSRIVNGPSKLKDSNGSNKGKARPKQVKETAKNIDTQPEPMSTDICVVAETKTSQPIIEQREAIDDVQEETKNADIPVIDDATEKRTADLPVQS